MESAAALPQLTAEEQRVLGALIEKSKTTPDYYPLTLNALVTACNQKSAPQTGRGLTREKKRKKFVFLCLLPKKKSPFVGKGGGEGGPPPKKKFFFFSFPPQRCWGA